MQLHKKILGLAMALTVTLIATAQQFPIQATTQLVPPYGVYLPDYATGINNQLRIVLVNRDLDLQTYTVKLRMTIELNGSLILRTSDFFNGTPITLQPNQPYSVEGLELAPYLNSNNIDFIGISKQEYEGRKGLPEGGYKICFTAFDFARADAIKVSNEACTYNYLTKNDPPFLNTPACGMYLAPENSNNENITDKAGRWFSYLLNKPITAEEKAAWYEFAKPTFEELAREKVSEDEMVLKIFSVGIDYANLKNYDIPPQFAEDWATQVKEKMIKNEIMPITKDLLKSNSLETNELPNNKLGDIIKNSGAYIGKITKTEWTVLRQNQWTNWVTSFFTQILAGVNNPESPFYSKEYTSSEIYNLGNGFINNYQLNTNADANWINQSVNEVVNNQIAGYFYSTSIKMVEADLEPFQTIGSAGNAQIVFTFTPRHISSPNSTLSTKYQFELYRILPIEALPDFVVQSTSPVFTDVTSNTTYTYGPDKPALIEGARYAWRIKAFDENGRDWFKNNGYSEVCFFTFGVTNTGGDPTATPNGNTDLISGVTATANDTRRGTISWPQTGNYTEYKVYYRKKGGTNTWFDKETSDTSIIVYDLEPNTQYEARVQGKYNGYWGPYSYIDTMQTILPTPDPACGIPINYGALLSQVPLPAADAKPLIFLKVGKFDILVDSIGPGNSPGIFSGKGSITNIPFLAIIQLAGTLAGNQNSGNGTGLKVTFNGIFVNINREVTNGEVWAVSRPLQEWLDGFDEYYSERRLEQQQAENRKRFGNLDSNAITLSQFDFEIASITYDTLSGVITIIDINGQSHTVKLTPEQKGHDIIIQGTGNDQWIVRPNGTIIPVKGGGVYSGMQTPISNRDVELVKSSLKILRNEFTNSKIESLERIKNNKLLSLKNITLNINSSIVQENSPLSNQGFETMDFRTGFIPGTELNNNNSNNNGYTDAFNDYQNVEKDYNRGYIIYLFAREFNTRDEYEMIVRNLKYNNIKITEYISQQKAIGKTDNFIIDDIKIAIMQLVDNILTNKIYK